MMRIARQEWRKTQEKGQSRLVMILMAFPSILSSETFGEAWSPLMTTDLNLQLELGE
jgi:hypothetical protein